jgi:hemolysin activation/secretion protein
MNFWPNIVPYWDVAGLFALRRLARFLFAVTLFAVPAVAQVPISSNDPTVIVAKPAKPTPELQKPEQEADSGATGDPQANAPRFTFTKAEFVGVRAVEIDALRPAWATAVGKVVSIADLRSIARRVEAIYAAKGYGFVVVVAAPQRVVDGTVRFEVIEGKISDLSVLGSDAVARRQATLAFRQLLGASPPAAAQLEMAFERAQAVPGLAVTGALRRGSGPGGLDLVVQTRRQEWQTYVNGNNQYSDAVGPSGILFGVDHFGHSAYGNQTSAQVYKSIGAGSQTIARLSHSHGLDSAGTTASFTIFGAWATPKIATNTLDFATKVKAGRIAISRPLVQRLGASASISTALDISDQDTRVFGATVLNSDKLRVLSLRMDGELRLPGARIGAAAQVRKGVTLFGASRRGDLFISRFGANPQAVIANVTVDADLAPAKSVHLLLKGEGQLANASLVAPQQFSVGNLSIGRGYQPGANYGDEALGLASELRFGPYVVGKQVRLSPSVFYDIVSLRTKTGSPSGNRTLSSLGPSLLIEVPDKLRIVLTYAIPLRPPLGLGEPKPSGRFLVNVTVGLNHLFDALGRGHGQGGKL